MVARSQFSATNFWRNSNQNDGTKLHILLGTSYQKKISTGFPVEVIRLVYSLWLQEFKLIYIGKGLSKIIIRR